MTSLAGHATNIVDCNLIDGYVITNAGFYHVQAVAWFPTSGLETSRQYTTVTTPPILIKLSPKPETNAPPQSNQGR